MKNFINNNIEKDPFACFLGVNIIEAKKGYSKCSLILNENMLNFLGTPHGGVIFSLADIAFSIAANFDYPPSYALDISGSYFASASVGDKLVSICNEINSTRKTGYYRMDVFLNDKLIATFNGTVYRKN